MLAQNDLTLRLVRLKEGKEWRDYGPSLCFIFPKGGTARFCSGQVVQNIGPGDVLVVNGSLGGTLTVHEPGEIVFWSFSVSVEHLLPLFGNSEIPLLHGMLERFKPLRLYPAASPLARECHGFLATVPPQFDLNHRSQLLRVAAAVLSPEFDSAHRQRVGFVRVEEHLLQVFEKLSVAELLTLSVAELAERFGCSRRHLSRLFHQYFGVSVAALRMEMRLSKAVSLLRDPNAKIINVAEQCGFGHLGLFNTCFKKRFGVSPGQWRNRTADTGNPPSGPDGAGQMCPLRLNGLCPWVGIPADAQPGKQSAKARISGSAKQSVNLQGFVGSSGSSATDGHELLGAVSAQAKMLRCTP